MVTLIGWLFANEPGPTIFLATTQDIAREFALDRFDHMIDSTPALRRVFLQGKANRETTFVKPAIGGKLILAGAGSPNKLISRPARYVFLDEEDRLPDFPKMGSAREIAEKRVREFGRRVRTGIFSIAHPTVPDVGVSKTYNDHSDRRRWHIECPHCGHEFAPAHGHIDIPDSRDPEDAVFRCPGCADPISDAQRWAASRRGRFVSTRGEDEPAPRFVGFHWTRLVVPRVPLSEIVGVFLAARNEAQLRVYFNMEMGEEYQEASIVLAEKDIRAKVDPRGVRRQCPAGTWHITLGVDVQKGTEARVLYYLTVAWQRNGNAIVIDFGKLLGWGALDAYAVKFEAAEEGRDEPRRIRAACIDYGWKTREVYTFCRLVHGGVRFIPIKHTPTVTRDEPTRRKQTRDPLHPELGNLTRLELCRDAWMDRWLGRFQADSDADIGGSVVLPPFATPELINHHTANHQVDVIDRNGHLHRKWQRDEKDKDDFAQAGLAAEVAAVGLGLDRVHEALPPRPPRDRHGETAGHVQRDYRQRRPGGYVRGRRRRRQ